MSIPIQWVVVGLSVGYLFSNGTLTWRGVLGCGGLLATGLAFLLYKYQEKLLFQPRIFPQHITPAQNPPGMRHPGEHGLGYEDVRIRTADGLSLHAWFVRPEDEAERKKRPTMVYFHENAGNMGMRMENLKMFYEELNLNILILSYRGYGESDGEPSEDGLYLDGEATFQYLLGRTDIDTSRIILFGRSLGGGVAIDLASKHLNEGISCVIVENTFSSITDMVDVVFPALAFAKKLILRMKFESSTKIRHITRPILFISGEQDEIVPSSQMKTLHTAAELSADKELVLFPHGQHNDTWRTGGVEYLQRIRAFIQKYAQPGSAAASDDASTKQKRAAL